MARPQFGIAQSGEAQHRPLGLETHGDSRGVYRSRGRFRAAGGIRRRRGPDSCPPTRRLSPTGRECTPTRRMSPSSSAAQASRRSSAGPVPSSSSPAPGQVLTPRPARTGPASIRRSGRRPQYHDALGESAHPRQPRQGREQGVVARDGAGKGDVVEQRVAGGHRAAELGGAGAAVGVARTRVLH